MTIVDVHGFGSETHCEHCERNGRPTAAGEHRDLGLAGETVLCDACWTGLSLLIACWAGWPRDSEADEARGIPVEAYPGPRLARSGQGDWIELRGEEERADAALVVRGDGTVEVWTRPGLDDSRQTPDTEPRGFVAGLLLLAQRHPLLVRGSLRMLLDGPGGRTVTAHHKTCRPPRPRGRP